MSNQEALAEPESSEKTATNSAVVTVFTTRQSQPCGKQLSLDADGKLTKKPLAHALNTAKQKRVTVADAQALADLLDGLTSSQALAFGVSNSEFENIITRKAKEAGVVGGTRTRNNFTWLEGAGVLMLDYDPQPGFEALAKDALLRALYEICPEVFDAAHVWRPSASSCIYRSDGTEIRGIAGQRIYILVRDASDIPRAGATLHAKTWLAGYGYFIVSKSGALLERGLFDASVFQPERLDFCGPSDCGEGLVQRMPATEVLGGLAFLDTRRALADLSAKDRAAVDARRMAVRAQMQDAQAAARDAYVKEHVPTLAKLAGINNTGASRVLIAATTTNSLLADFVLRHSGGHVTVGEVLDDPERWHHRGFLDPLEPDYQPHNYRIARAELFSGGQPTIWSFAHGGSRYTLHRQRSTIAIEPGQGPDTRDKVLSLLRMRDSLLFQRGFGAESELVGVQGSHIIPLCEVQLRDRIERIASFTKYNSREKESKPTDCPRDLALMLHRSRGAWRLRSLRGVITAPTLRPDGTVLTTPGYDAGTGLLLLNLNDFDFAVPSNPDMETVRRALDYLWRPFREFPLMEDTDKGVLLAAILTAVIRRPLPSAPGFLFGASAAGSGKTLLASTVGYLCSGADPDPQPWSEGMGADEEVKKLLLSALRTTDGVLLLDNIEGTLKSAALAAVLTKPSYTDRVLGESRRVAVSTNVLLLLSGNNVAIHGDMNRRVLRCRIDPGVERPDTRVFDFDPLAIVKRDRVNICRAALLLIQAYRNSGARPGAGSTASFETWDAHVRQTVCWLAEQVPGFGLADPTASLTHGYQDDPELEQLGAFLAAWIDVFGEWHVRIRDIRRKVQGLQSGSADVDVIALRDACMEVAAGRDGEPDAQKLGSYVRKSAGRIVDGLVLSKFSSDRKHGAIWTVRRGDKGDCVVFPMPRTEFVSDKKIKVVGESPPKPLSPPFARDQR